MNTRLAEKSELAEALSNQVGSLQVRVHELETELSTLKITITQKDFELERHALEHENTCRVYCSKKVKLNNK